MKNRIFMRFNFAIVDNRYINFMYTSWLLWVNVVIVDFVRINLADVDFLFDAWSVQSDIIPKPIPSTIQCNTISFAVVVVLVDHGTMPILVQYHLFRTLYKAEFRFIINKNLVLRRKTKHVWMNSYSTQYDTHQHACI